MTTDFGARVKAELFTRNMSQKDLANLVGISSVYLSDILRERKDGPKVQLHKKKIEKILDLKKEGR